MANIATVYDWPGKCNQNRDPTKVSIPFPEFAYMHFFKETWFYYIAFCVGLQITQDIQIGALGLPVFKHYYYAANARALTYGKGGSTTVKENPLWLQSKAAAVNVSSPSAIFFSNPAPAAKLQFTNLNANK